jgi:biopolymer transport protein ExbD
MTPEEVYLAKKAAKAQARRDKEEDKGDLNITSLMDIVSIIVVYLLKTYGSDPVIITPTAGQKVPLSQADSPLQDGVPIYISSRDITFEGKKLVQIGDDGEVDAAALNKNLIGPLYDALAEEADKAKAMAEARGTEWPGRVIVVGDEKLKFKTLVNVMYTAGRAEYQQYAFCVIKAGG